MTQNPLRSRAGFTYIAALVMVVIMGILLSQAAQYWSMRMQREREVELIFRGTQVRDALRLWYNGTTRDPAAPAVPGTSPANTPPPPGRVKHGPLPELKSLLSDPGQAGRGKFLRPAMLVDPITGKEWGLVKDASQRIVGVASTSEQQPIKQGNFPLDLDPADFEGKKKYSEWQFIFSHFPKPGGTGTVTGLKTTGAAGSDNFGSGSPGSGSSIPGQTRPEAVPVGDSIVK